MMGSTHLVVGLGVGLALALHHRLPADTAGLLMGAAALGALLPDIDHPGSMVGRRTRLVSIPLHWLVAHRGLTHTLLALALVYFGASFLPFPALFAPAVALGYASHLVADMMTRHGLAVLWPVWRRPIHLLPRGLRMASGGMVESVLGLLVLVGMGLVVLNLY